MFRARIPHRLVRVLTPELLDRALERERCRAERLKGSFSMLLFEQREDDAGREAFEPLLELLIKRVRLCDEIGWTADDRLAVILLDTPAAGAVRVLDDVLATYPTDRGEPPLCTAYSYPGEKLAIDSEGASGLGGQPPVQPMEPLFVRPLPWWKRLIDLAASGMALSLLWPLMLYIAVRVKLDSPGPVFFPQRRTGLGGRPFTIYKFRTMRVGADAEKATLRAQSEQDGPAFKMTNDPRVTPYGDFLRSSSLDELPQLWNVFKGDMSLVGPRPLPCDEADGCSTWQKRRLEVTPGLTCIWQVEGRSTVSFERWMRMDLQYIRSRNFWFDLSLLWRTIPAVLARRGAK